MELRHARRADVEAIADLARVEVERGLKWTWDADRVADELQQDDTLCVVADDAGVIGFCLTAFAESDAHILLIAVAHDAQRRGIGAQLLGWQLDCVRTAGIQKVSLELRASNLRARKFYEKQGFEVVRRVKNYYQGREDALRMVLRL